MKKYVSLLTVVTVVSLAARVYGQDVVEIQKPVASTGYTEVSQTVDALGTQDREKAIELWTDALSRIDNSYERFEIIFWKLSFLYAEDGRYQNSCDILRRGQDEGLFYPLLVGESQWPEYVPGLKSLNGFDAFLARNDELRREAQRGAQFEYIVQLPAGYRKDKTYPLLVALHGGFGSHIASTESWRSPRLDSEFVVVSVQGTEFLGSFLRSYLKEDMARIVEAYRQVAEKYSIDTSRVILAGPSAGGARAIILAQNRLIPAAGLILAFPVKPQSLDEQKLDSVAATGIRAAFLCGEKDWAIKQQKEMGVIFDKHNIPNRFIIASGIGHDFPPDFAEEIDRSLAYLFNKE